MEMQARNWARNNVKGSSCSRDLKFSGRNKQTKVTLHLLDVTLYKVRVCWSCEWCLGVSQDYTMTLCVQLNSGECFCESSGGKIPSSSACVCLFVANQYIWFVDESHHRKNYSGMRPTVLMVPLQKESVLTEMLRWCTSSSPTSRYYSSHSKPRKWFRPIRTWRRSSQTKYLHWVYVLGPCTLRWWKHCSV